MRLPAKSGNLLQAQTLRRGQAEGQHGEVARRGRKTARPRRSRRSGAQGRMPLPPLETASAGRRAGTSHKPRTLRRGRAKGQHGEVVRRGRRKPPRSTDSATTGNCISGLLIKAGAGRRTLQVRAPQAAPPPPPRARAPPRSGSEHKASGSNAAGKPTRTATPTTPQHSQARSERAMATAGNNSAGAQPPEPLE